jgi:hypothetical protein
MAEIALNCGSDLTFIILPVLYIYDNRTFRVTHFLELLDAKMAGRVHNREEEMAFVRKKGSGGK